MPSNYMQLLCLRREMMEKKKGEKKLFSVCISRCDRAFGCVLCFKSKNLPEKSVESASNEQLPIESILRSIAPFFLDRFASYYSFLPKR
jgi:hypothetical protein